MTLIVPQTSAPGPLARVHWAVVDTLTMARRTLVVWLRVPSYIAFTVAQPVMFVLLFRYSIGGAMQVHVVGGYVNFLMPGAIAQAAAFSASGTGVALAHALQTGMVDRLRSMPISRAAVLGGHLVAVTVRMVATILIVFAVGYAIGARFESGVGPTAAQFAVAVAFGITVCSVSAYTGLAVRDLNSVEVLGPMWLFPLIFLSSAFAPTSTMPGWLRMLANNQPVSFVIDTMRTLALGGPVALSVCKTIAWLAGIFAVFTALGIRAYNHVA
jgi:ABC transporter DrrB family efflux protein